MGHKIADAIILYVDNILLVQRYSNRRRYYIFHVSLKLFSQQRKNKMCSYCSGTLIGFTKWINKWRTGIPWNTFYFIIRHCLLLSFFSFPLIIFLNLYFLLQFLSLYNNRNGLICYGYVQFLMWLSSIAFLRHEGTYNKRFMEMIQKCTHTFFQSS